MNSFFATYKHSWIKYNNIKIQLCSLIIVYALQRRFISTGFVISRRTTLTSNSYHSKHVCFKSLLIWIHNFRKILIICAYKWFLSFVVRQKQKDLCVQTHNLLMSMLVFLNNSYLFCVSCICWGMDQSISITSYVLCSIWKWCVLQTLIMSRRGFIILK